jgi:plastocyanin
VFRRLFGGVVISTVAAIAVACGGGGSSPTAPSGGSGGGTAPVGATITISSSGVTNNNVSVSVGQSVMFVNNDTKAHNMNSDPHPVHTDCPALNVGSIAPGASATSGALTTARSCGYHDHNDASNPAFHGTVVVR